MAFTWRSALEELEKESRRFQATVERERRGRTLPKFGHLVTKEEYLHLTELLREILPNAQIREAAYRKHRANLCFITFVHLCGLIQWDYEQSFWEAFNVLFGGRAETPLHRFIRESVIAPVCRQLGLTLQRSDGGRTARTMYVASLIGAAGIPPRRVGKVREFVAWFYREHGHLVSAGLSSDEFSRLLVSYKGLTRDEKDELSTILYDAASNTVRLVDELKARGYEAEDLAVPAVVGELESVLGYRPADIFGFRGHEAFLSLVGELTQQIAPAELAPLVRRLQARLGTVKVISPRGQTLTVVDTERLGRVAYGRYLLDYRGGRREVHVSPRAAFGVPHMEWLLSNQAWVFYEWDNGLLGVWGPEPFEVIDSRRGEEPSHLVCAAGREGYLWAGTQSVGALLICQTGGVERARLDPPEGVILNPRLRLRPDREGLELVIPSMVLHQPDHAGRTVLLEVNGRPVTDGRLVVNRNGHLQFSQNRRYPLQGDEKELEVAVRLEQGGTVLYRHRPISLTDPIMLFRSNDRERVPPGDRRFVPEQVVLVSRSERPQWQLPAGALIPKRTKFGPWHLFQIQLPGGAASPVELMAGGLAWSFATVSAMALDLRPGPVPLGPWQGREGMLVNGQTADMVISPGGAVDEAADDLALAITTGRDRSCRASLTELQRLGLVSKGSTGEWLVDFRSLQKRYLSAEPYGEYHLILQDADFQQLSEVQVSVLPSLTVRPDPLYYEETESWLSIDCDRQELITEGSDEGVLSTRIRFVPKLIQAPDGTLVPQLVRAEVSLKYPETIVAFQLYLVVAGLRVVSRGNILPAGDLNHNQLSGGSLIIVGPVGHEVSLSCGLAKWRLDIPESGALKFPLDQVVKGLSEQRTLLAISLGDWRRELTIHWPLSVRLDREQVTLTRPDDQTLRIAAHPTVDGPHGAQIDVSLNGLFDPLARGTWSVAELAAGEAVLDVPLNVATAEDTLYLEVRSGGQKLAEVELPADAAVGTLIRLLGRSPEELTDDELLRAAILSGEAGNAASLANLVGEVNRRAQLEIAAPLVPEEMASTIPGPESLLRRLEANRRLGLEGNSLRRQMVSPGALKRLADAWEQAEISEEVAEAYVNELAGVALGQVSGDLQHKLLELPFPSLSQAIVKSGVGCLESSALRTLVDMVNRGDCTAAEAADWIRPVLTWAMESLTAMGLNEPAVRRLLSELAASGSVPPFIQVGATITMDSRQGKVTAIQAGGQAVTYAPFPALRVMVSVSVKGEGMTLYADGAETWLKYQDRDKVMTCLYPDCGFASADTTLFYPHLDTHRGVDWKKTFQARGTPQLWVRRVDWQNQPEPKGPKGNRK